MPSDNKQKERQQERQVWLGRRGARLTVTSAIFGACAVWLGVVGGPDLNQEGYRLVLGAGHLRDPVSPLLWWASACVSVLCVAALLALPLQYAVYMADAAGRGAVGGRSYRLLGLAALAGGMLLAILGNVLVIGCKWYSH